MKNLFLIAMACVLTFSLASCGGGSKDKIEESEDNSALLEQQRQDSIREAEAEAEAKAEAERLQKEQAEKEEQARLEAERLQKEQEERDRIEAEKAARGPEWLRGRFCYERIDQTFYEIVYEVFYFDNDGTYRFGESRSSKYFKPSNRPIKYTVKDNVIYTDDGRPLLRINDSNHSLSRYEDSSVVFSKV